MTAIVRQSEQYAIFDAPPRRDRVAFEAPAEIVREYSRGQTVGAGMNNPRRVAKKTWCPDCQKIVPESGHGCGDDDEDEHRKEAVNTFGMDPDEHAYATEEPMGPGPGRDYNPYAGWEPSEEDERRREQVGEDDDSGYNWGPVPGHDPGMEPGPHPDFQGDRPLPMGTPVYNPRSGPYDNISGRRLGFSRQADDGPVPMPGPAPMAAPGDGLGPDLFGDGGFEHENPQLFTYMFLGRPPDPRAYMLGGLGVLTPGSRVGLPYKGGIIPGVVTHFAPDSQVGVRWHDGQHSVENPGDIRPL